MFKNKMFLSLQSFVAIPIFATNFTLAPYSDFMKLPPARVSATVENRLLVSVPVDNKQLELETMAKKIDAYFVEKNLPLRGYGKKFVQEAVKNDLPLTILPAIAMAESTGYKFACPKDPDNGFGWRSCDGDFSSIDEAIETVARNLGGNNPNTEHHYKDKDLQGILAAYNPPHIAPKYRANVLSIMKAIEESEIDNASLKIVMK